MIIDKFQFIPHPVLLLNYPAAPEPFTFDNSPYI